MQGKKNKTGDCKIKNQVCSTTEIESSTMPHTPEVSRDISATLTETTENHKVTSQTRAANDTAKTAVQTHSTPQIILTQSPEDISATDTTTGVAIGIAAGMVVVIGVIVMLVYRRQKCIKRKNINGEERTIHNNDYLGQQDIALPDIINGDLTTQEGHQHYHEITTDFTSTNETSTYFEIDDEFDRTTRSESEIEQHGTVDKHNYFSLDPQETGFNRLNKNTPDNDTSKKKFSIAEGNKSMSNGNVLNTLVHSSNYSVLDPNETGFNRENQFTLSTVYELAQPLSSQSKIMENDQYSISKTGTYDISGKITHNETPENVYNHMCDSEYDTLKHNRNVDATNNEYDHFKGEKTK